MSVENYSIQQKQRFEKNKLTCLIKNVNVYYMLYPDKPENNYELWTSSINQIWTFPGLGFPKLRCLNQLHNPAASLRRQRETLNLAAGSHGQLMEPEPREAR